MIHESCGWKKDLKYRKNKLIKYNTCRYFDKNFEKSCVIIEKSIFYSAFIIRKLLDCDGKLSDDAEKYKLPIKNIKPIKKIHLLNRWDIFENYDLDKTESATIYGRLLCNYLIHSFVFQFNFNNEMYVSGFYVSSDRDKNIKLYLVDLDEWIKYIDYIYSDNIKSLSMCYNDKGEISYKEKKRGI